MTKDQDYIDVSEELTKRDQQRLLAGERDTAALNGSQSRLMPGSKTFLALLLGISGIFGGVMVYKAYQTKSPSQVDEPPTGGSVRQASTNPSLA